MSEKAAPRAVAGPAWQRFTHLAVLWAFAVAAPLLQTLGDDPAFFVARNSTAFDLVIFTLGLVAVPPAIMLATELAVARFAPGAARLLHLGWVGLISSILVIVVAKRVISGPAGVLIAVAVISGVGLAAAYARTRFLPSTLSVLSPAPLIFAALFLFTAPISKLLFPVDPHPPARSVSSPAPVVFVVFDELPLATLLRPGGEIDRSRFPGFARLAAGATWYRRATTVAPFTHRAVPALLSGVLNGGKVPSLADHPRNLFTELAGGYRMHVVEPATALCPESACGPPRRGSFGSRISGMVTDARIASSYEILPDSLTGSLPPIDQGFAHFLDYSQSNRDLRNLDRFIAAIDDQDRTLHFIHTPFLPHPPWRLRPDGSTYLPLLNQAALSDPMGVLADQPAAIEELWKQHTLQAGLADAKLGELIDQLKRVGVWDRALVVVAADHGASFQPGTPRRGISATNLGSIAPVPLFVKAPGQERGRVVAAPSCLTRVVPLIERQLGVEPAIPSGACRRVHRIFRAASQATIDRQLERVVARQARLFEPGGGWGAIYESQDRWGLTGRRVDRIAAAPSSELSVELDPQAVERHGDGLSPANALIVGDASGLRSNDRIAVAIDGEIVAVGVTFVAEGHLQVMAMLPPEIAMEGRLALYRVVPAGRSAGLSPITIRVAS